MRIRTRTQLLLLLSKNCGFLAVLHSKCQRHCCISEASKVVLEDRVDVGVGDCSDGDDETGVSMGTTNSTSEVRKRDN